MTFLIRATIAWFALAMTVAVATNDQDSISLAVHGKNVLCKLNDEDVKIHKNDIRRADFRVCSHVEFNATQLQLLDPFSNTSGAEDEKNPIKEQLKDKDPKIKFLAMVNFEHMLQTFKHTKQKDTFIKNLVAYASNNNYNGYDMLAGDLRKFNHEHDNDHESNYKDSKAFLNELKESFQKSNLILVMSVSAKENFPPYDNIILQTMIDCVDLINYLPEYEVFKSPDWYGYEDAKQLFDMRNQIKMIELLNEIGIPSTKLIMGLHLGGAWFHPNSKLSFLDYRWIRQREAMTNDYKKTYDQEANVAMLAEVRKTLSSDESFVYMDTRSIANRVRYAIKHNMAGVSVNSIMADDYAGALRLNEDPFVDFKATRNDVTLHIGRRHSNGHFPILRTINLAINVALDEMKQERELGNVSGASHSTPFIYYTVVTVMFALLFY